MRRLAPTLLGWGDPAAISCWRPGPRHVQAVDASLHESAMPRLGRLAQAWPGRSPSWW
jgi:hypothetical protein